MRGEKKRRVKYTARYEENRLDLKLEKETRLKINLKDSLEVGILLAKFKESGLGSSRELGRLFRRSASTVINKTRLSKMGSKRLIDRRRQKRRYKLENVQAEILLIWIKMPVAEDRELFEELCSLGIRLDLKTLKRCLKETGIEKARSRLRAEGLKETEDKSDTAKREEKEIIQSQSRYAGQMLHLPEVYRMNFPEVVKELPSPEEEDCVYSIERVAHLLYFLYGMGGKRLYDLDSVEHKGLGVLIGMEDNLRSSGMNKRVSRMAKASAIEVFQNKALVGRGGLIRWKDLELAYCDTHVIEVYVNKFIPMARHGTKNKQVKAINVHYLIGSETGTPLAKEYTSGNKRLHWAIPHLIKRADEGLKGKVRIICNDKGGWSVHTIKELIKRGKGFICWGKRTEYVRRQIEKIKAYRFRYKRKKEIRHDGRVMKVEERLADTTTHLEGLGKMRTVVVQLPEIEGGERLWMYTNLRRSRYEPIQIRDMMRYKQRQEIYFKSRKNRSALDCFAGGRYKVKPIRRPGKKVVELLEKGLMRLKKRIEKSQNSLSDIKELKSHGIYKADTAKREIEYLIRRIKQDTEEKRKIEEKIHWAEGGKRPEFIKQRYELELEKQKTLNEFQDMAFLAKRESMKGFFDCYKKVLEKEGLSREEIVQRMKYLDRVAIEKELFGLGGIISCDKRYKRMTVTIIAQGREYFRKALSDFLHQQNNKQITLDYGKKEKYLLQFCLSPPG